MNIENITALSLIDHTYNYIHVCPAGNLSTKPNKMNKRRVKYKVTRIRAYGICTKGLLDNYILCNHGSDKFKTLQTK